MSPATRFGKSAPDETDAVLLQHLRALGLATVQEYVAWCARHGFSRRTAKSERQRLQERAFATRAVADARLAQKKHELRNPEKVIERILRGELREPDVTQPHFKLLCRARPQLKSCPRARQSLFDLLIHCGQYADLFDAHPVVPHYGRSDANTLLGGLLALARHAACWLRPPGAWKPQTHNARRQFAALARHLFALWPVPAFFDSVWFTGDSAEALRQQRWFLHVGRGENIRTADLPLPYTKRMAHQFLRAPADFTAEAALRWGQVHALGGGDRLARAVIGTRLGTCFDHDDFWVTVLRFFVAHPMLDLAQAGPIIDFIHHQRFVAQEVFVAPGVVERQGPPQPDFSMKGRTPASVLRQVESWHRGLTRTQQPQADWPRSGIEPLQFTEGSERGGNLKVWTITELLSTKALVAEGRAMKHCVATYARSCARGACSIWALEVQTFEGRAKVLTVEVRNETKLICQARGKYNALPADKPRAILRRWAEQAGLSLAGG